MIYMVITLPLNRGDNNDPNRPSNLIADNHDAMYEYYFQKGYSGVPIKCHEFVRNVQATYNPCQATSLPDAMKTAFTSPL